MKYYAGSQRWTSAGDDKKYYAGSQKWTSAGDEKKYYAGSQRWTSAGDVNNYYHFLRILISQRKGGGEILIDCPPKAIDEMWTSAGGDT